MRLLPDLDRFGLVRSPKKTVRVWLNGLNGTYAEIASTIGYSTSIGPAFVEQVKWSDSPDPAAPATYGTGDTALDFAASDGAMLYLHLTLAGVVYTRSAPVRQAVAPSALSAPVIIGTASVGAVLTATAATFDGAGTTVSHVWEESADGLTGWSDTGVSGLTGPTLVLDRHYRVVAQATNSRGSATATSNAVGPVTPVTVQLNGLNGTYAEIASTIGYSTSIGPAFVEQVKWSDSPDPAAPATYGTGDTALDFAASDGAMLYLHLTLAGVVYTRSAPVRQAVAPSALSAPVIIGTASVGAVLTATAATFDGAGTTVSHVWEESADGLTGWSDTGASGLTGPTLVLDRHYRVVAQATNSRGSATATSNAVGPVIDGSAEPSVVIESLTIGASTGGSLNVNISATGAQGGDAITWSLAPSGGGADVASNPDNSLVWPGSTVTLPSGIPSALYVLTVTVGDSVPVTSAPFTVETVAPVLSAPVTSTLNDTITWGITSDEAAGTIHAALRLDTTAAGAAQDIIDGTGYLATVQDTSPTADAANAGQFTATASGTYVVDFVQVDDFGNVSAIVTDTVVISVNADDWRDDFDTYTNNTDLTVANTDYVARENGSPEVQTQSGGIVVGDGVTEAVHYTAVTLDSTNQSVLTTVAVKGSVHYLYIDINTVTPNDYYSFEVNAITGDWAVKRWDAGAATQMNTGTLSPAPDVGDELEFRREGNALKALMNGTEFYTRNSGSTVVHMTGYGGFGSSFGAASSRFRLRKV